MAAAIVDSVPLQLNEGRTLPASRPVTHFLNIKYISIILNSKRESGISSTELANYCYRFWTKQRGHFHYFSLMNHLRESKIPEFNVPYIPLLKCSKTPF
jgi:hypothetical protein